MRISTTFFSPLVGPVTVFGILVSQVSHNSFFGDRKIFCLDYHNFAKLASLGFSHFCFQQPRVRSFFTVFEKLLKKGAV